jgi:hypothetical protein
MKGLSFSQFKELAPVIAGLCILMLLDMTLRLSLEDREGQRPWKPAASTPAALKRLTSKDAVAIMTALGQYDTPQVESAQSATDANTVSAEQQAKQEGNLDQLYVGQLRFRLVGVFSRGERFAVLQQRDVTQNSKPELKKVEIGDTLNDYMVVGIDIDRVQLDTEDGRQVVLMLFSKSQPNDVNNLKK